MRILTLCGSIRANARHSAALMALAQNSASLDDFICRGQSLYSRGIILSNSEYLAASAMMGAYLRGAELDYYPLKSLFNRRDASVLNLRPHLDATHDLSELAFLDSLSISKEELDALYDRIMKAQGIILATPVYFGDRSSVANKFMQITSRENLLRDKIFGVVSVGAKRNGGQESCNIFSMMESLNQNALVVGNGPPTSQYGGTAVGGNKSQVLNDHWGLQTAMGTGIKVSHVAQMYNQSMALESHDKLRVDILVTMDTGDRFFAGYLENLVKRVNKDLPWVDFHIHQLIASTIYRCLGCHQCPAVSTISGDKAQCAIKDPDDIFDQLRLSLLKSDCLIIAGLNIIDVEKVIYRYQVLMERMRYIRRNDYELTDLLISGLCYHQFGATQNPYHSLKTLTSYIRHNTTIYRSIEIMEHKSQYLEDGKTPLKNLCLSARRMKSGKKQMPCSRGRYNAFGEGGGYLENSESIFEDKTSKAYAL